MWLALKLREKAISFEKRSYHIRENFPVLSYNRNPLLCNIAITLVSHGTRLVDSMAELRFSRAQNTVVICHVGRHQRLFFDAFFSWRIISGKGRVCTCSAF